MEKKERVMAGGAILLAVVLSSAPVSALSISEAIDKVADRLQANQIKEGVNAGSWPQEADFTGSIAAGMVSAYEQTCNDAYRGSAELAGDYILWAAQGNFYGDEAFALTYLSEIAADPCNNTWRTEVGSFYHDVKQRVGTEVYISGFAGTEPSTAVFYLANHVVAAYYVDAEDKEIWRQGLIDWLAQVDDSCSFPVMGLGVATWALALTGPLDETLIDPSGTGAPYWGGKRLSGLPALLLSHQVPAGQPDAGSFYWRFDHGDGGSGSAVSGYTEDTIFGTLGLIAASEVAANPELDCAIPATRQVLLDGIGSEGTVWERLSQEGEVFYAYAGEMLEVLGELVFPGDLNLNGRVDFIDFAILGENWHKSGCTMCDWCNGADLDQSGAVNFDDLRIFALHWLKGISN